MTVIRATIANFRVLEMQTVTATSGEHNWAYPPSLDVSFKRHRRRLLSRGLVRSGIPLLTVVQLLFHFHKRALTVISDLWCDMLSCISCSRLCRGTAARFYPGPAEGGFLPGLV